MLNNFIAAFKYLRAHKECNENIGVVGFCFGGYIGNMMAALVPELKAAIPYYGGQPPTEYVKDIQCPLLLHFAELDQRVNEGWSQYESDLKMHNKEYSVHFYQDANHGFHNDTTPRYDKEAAQFSWSKTIEFFKLHLK